MIKKGIVVRKIQSAAVQDVLETRAKKVKGVARVFIRSIRKTIFLERRGTVLGLLRNMVRTEKGALQRLYITAQVLIYGQRK